MFPPFFIDKGDFVTFQTGDSVIKYKQKRRNPYDL